MNTKNIVPPKLKAKFLLGGLSIWEIAIAAALVAAGFFSDNRFNAVLWGATWVVFSVRLYRGKSIRKLFSIMISYHISQQKFTRRVRNNEKTRSNGKTNKV